MSLKLIHRAHADGSVVARPLHHPARPFLAIAAVPLRVAAVSVAPWVVQHAAGISGLEVRVLRNYCQWRERRADICVCAASQVPGLLVNGEVDLAIGGLTESDGLSSIAHLMAFSRRRLALGEPPHGALRLHVWALSRANPIDHWHLRAFLCAWRWRQAQSPLTELP